jgi:hypothetical protein
MKAEIKPTQDATIQSRVRQDLQNRISLVLWLAGGADLISPWWSKQRDSELRKFYKQVDMLSGAVATLAQRMTTIPFKVVPKDRSVRAHQVQAERFFDLLWHGSEWTKGWLTFYSKWLTDLLTQDNGAFAEIIGEGEADSNLLGMPLGVAHLDSWRCTRTSNPEFPVLYQNTEGDIHKLHYTRVAYASLDPSPIAEMYDVGLCPVSKCLNVAQNVLDILVYKQEKLGSRPHRNILVAKGGLDPDDIREAFALAAEDMDNQGLGRYSKTVVVGSSTLEDAALEQHDLSSLPDGFDYKEDTTLAMAAIALAFGVDARELWPMMGVGATRADALIQHLKSRQKGIGQLIAMTEQTFSSKVLPASLQLVFDYQDDAQDRQVAEVRKIRAERHQIDLTTEALDVRTVREQMLEAGDITQDQFEDLELQDGRLEDGSSALTLFYHPDYSTMLDMGIPNPLDVEANDWALVRPILTDKRDELLQALGLLKDHRKRKLVREALAALQALRSEYEGLQMEAIREEAARANGGQEAEEEGQEPSEQEEAEEAAAGEDLSDTEEDEVV